MEEPILKVGQVIWRVNNKPEVYPSVVTKSEWVVPKHCSIGGYWYYEDDSGNRCYEKTLGKFWFYSREEAEQEVERYRKITTKRLMLLEYEEKLNEMLGLEDHFIVRKNKGE